MSLYNRAKKYSKYYFWDYGMILTNEGLSIKEIDQLIKEIGVIHILKVEFPKIRREEIIESINNENRLLLNEKQDLLDKLPYFSFDSTMQLKQYIILIESTDKEVMEKCLIEKGFYPILLEDTFKYRI